MRRAFTPLVVLCACAWLAASVGLKVLRAHLGGEPVEAQAERTLSEFLRPHGWAPAGRARLTTAGLYHVQVFAKEGCQPPLLVVALGASDEAAPMIRSLLGEDVAFIAAGRVSADLSVFAYKVHALAAGLSLDRRAIMPILAVSPAPPQIGAPDAGALCRPPTALEWARLSARS